MEPTRIDFYSGSALGNSHKKNSKPNQDAVGSWHSAKHNYFCVAISDGHGSSKHPFSKEGSTFAVETAIEAYKECISGKQYDISPHRLMGEILVNWRNKCLNHHIEKESVEELDVSTGGDHCDTYRLYGATLCIAYRSLDTIIIASIGDSTAHFQNQSGKFSQSLLSDDCFGEETFSLCQRKPLESLECKYLPLCAGLLTLSTDGVIKSLKSSKDYQKISEYYLGLMSKQTDRFVIERDIEEQLAQFSEMGSGDDCTLAFLYLHSEMIDEVEDEYRFPVENPKKKHLLVLALIMSLLVPLSALSLVRQKNVITAMLSVNQSKDCDLIQQKNVRSKEKDPQVTQ